MDCRYHFVRKAVNAMEGTNPPKAPVPKRKRKRAPEPGAPLLRQAPLKLRKLTPYVRPDTPPAAPGPAPTPPAVTLASKLEPFSTDNPVVQMKTVQVNWFRVIVDALKSIVDDVEVWFNADGMRIADKNRDKTIFVELFIDKKKIDYYDCVKPAHIGISLVALYHLIRYVNANESDVITLQMETTESNTLDLFMETSIKNTLMTYNLIRLDLPDVYEMEMARIQYDAVITFQSSDFQRYVRDLAKLGHLITFTTKGDQLEISSKGTTAYGKQLLRDNTKLINIEPLGKRACSHLEADNSSKGGDKKKKTLSRVKPLVSILVTPGMEIVQTFEASSLEACTKATNVAQMVEIRMSPGCPMQIAYNINSMGSIKFLLWEPVALRQAASTSRTW